MATLGRQIGIKFLKSETSYEKIVSFLSKILFFTYMRGRGKERERERKT